MSLVACSQVDSMLQELINTTHTVETRCFFAEKLNLLPDKKLLNDVPLQTAKFRKKDLFSLYVDNEIPQLIGDVPFKKCKNEQGVHISTNQK